MSSLVAAYEQLLLDNVGTVHTVESTIRNVTWFLPGRFADAEIASEGLYALLSIVSSGHDALLDRRIPASLSLPPHPFAPEPPVPTTTDLFTIPPPPASRTAPLLPPASEHARYTRYWTRTSAGYRRAARVLATLNYVELLTEMVARRRAGDAARWKVVLGIESLKTMLRLIILLITRRPVLQPPTPQREYDIALVPHHRLLGRDGKSPESAAAAKAIEEKEKDDDSDEHTPEDTRPAVVPLIGARAPLRTHLYPLVSALPEECQAHPNTLLPELHGQEFLAEVMSSSAVLLQVLLLIRAARSPASPAYRRASLPTLSRALGPFFLPLLLQLAARRLRAPPGDSTLLAEHYSQLDRKIATRFFLQGPMWIGWTRPKVVRGINLLEKIPLIGLAGRLVESYLPLVDEYFYMVA